MIGPTLVASSTQTTTGNGSAVSSSIGKGDNLGFITLLLQVTAVSGTTPTLDLSVEWTNDGTTFYKGDPADAFTQITANTNVAKRFAIKGAKYRLAWTIGGTTPSFTINVNEVVH